MGGDGSTSQCFMQICFAVTVHIRLQRFPLSTVQTPMLLGKPSLHSVCQRFALHNFGMQQQDEGKKFPLPLEELIFTL